MKVHDDPPVHLTYCLNIHKGEAWAENLSAIESHAKAVRDAVAGGKPFGLGLRLGAKAAAELDEGDRLERLADLLTAEGMYAFTINGFPYGPFHGEAVKADVYRPDWRDPRRRDYTTLLARLLARLLPEGVTGSISTVPGSYRQWIATPADEQAMAERLAETAGELHAIEQATGRRIVLALEPEPDCYVETIDQAIAFFDGPLDSAGAPHLAAGRGTSVESARELLRRHVGLCLDTAHAAVEFEDPAEALRRLRDAGVLVAKVQLSAALSATPGPVAVERLRPFCEPVYLHQAKARTPDGRVLSFPDLPDLLASREAASADEWRVHFHVPLFFRGDGVLHATSELLTGEFAAALRSGACEHLEIETYTFGVLPDTVRPATVVDCIVGEYRWVMENLLRG